MSPGATFERVYHELKRMLTAGELPPGTPIEPMLIGRQIASSFTPVRDALHRLTGERLVEAPNHNGFRVPLMTEAALRDLYSWNAQLLVLATAHIARSPTPPAAPATTAERDLADRTASLFAQIARTSGSGEHLRAVSQLNDRLAPVRRCEARLLPGLEEELAKLWQCFATGDHRQLTRQLRAYHRLRLRSVAALVAVSPA